MGNEGTYGLTEAAERVGMSTLALVQLVTRRRLPCVVEGGRIRIERALIDSFVTPTDYVPVAQEAREQGALSLSEAIERLGANEDDFARALLDRRIPHVLIQGVVHVPEAALEEYRLRAS